jgi:hypothetical protein
MQAHAGRPPLPTSSGGPHAWGASTADAGTPRFYATGGAWQWLNGVAAQSGGARVYRAQGRALDADVVRRDVRLREAAVTVLHQAGPLHGRPLFLVECQVLVVEEQHVFNLAQPHLPQQLAVPGRSAAARPSACAPPPQGACCVAARCQRAGSGVVYNSKRSRAVRALDRGTAARAAHLSCFRTIGRPCLGSKSHWLRGTACGCWPPPEPAAWPAGAAACTGARGAASVQLSTRHARTQGRRPQQLAVVSAHRKHCSRSSPAAHAAPGVAACAFRQRS